MRMEPRPTAPLEDRLLEALTEVIDPEVGVDIVSLGLVYEVRAGGDGVYVRMTMTTPACPLGPYLREQVEDVIRREQPSAPSVTVEIVWDPPWSPERMTSEARRALGWPDEGEPSLGPLRLSEDE